MSMRRPHMSVLRVVIAGARRGRSSVTQISATGGRPFVVRSLDTQCRWRPAWWRRAINWYCTQIAATGADVVNPLRWSPSTADRLNVRFNLEINGRVLLGGGLATLGALELQHPIVVPSGQPLTVAITNDSRHAYAVTVILLGTVEVEGASGGFLKLASPIHVPIRQGWVA
jgi:hypothetical protein